MKKEPWWKDLEEAGACSIPAKAKKYKSAAEAWLLHGNGSEMAWYADRVVGVRIELAKWCVGRPDWNKGKCSCETRAAANYIRSLYPSLASLKRKKKK